MNNGLLRSFNEKGRAAYGIASLTLSSPTCNAFKFGYCRIDAQIMMGGGNDRASSDEEEEEDGDHGVDSHDEGSKVRGV